MLLITRVAAEAAVEPEAFLELDFEEDAEETRLELAVAAVVDPVDLELLERSLLQVLVAAEE